MSLAFVTLTSCGPLRGVRTPQTRNLKVVQLLKAEVEFKVDYFFKGHKLELPHNCSCSAILSQNLS